MNRLLRLGLLAVVAVGLLAGCSRARVHSLSLYEYPSKPRGYEMEAYFGEVEQLYVPIAIIDSAPRDVVNDETREKMLAEVKRAARKIGADALHKVRFIGGEGAGYVEDPATPFPSLKQGPYEMNYLRAEAIKFPDPERDAASQPAE